VERAEQVDEILRAALAHDGPALVEFLIEQEANVFPMIPPGASLSEPIESEDVTAPPAPRLVPA
jgi:acetolactate synthase-1/2/3 large subunit